MSTDSIEFQLESVRIGSFLFNAGIDPASTVEVAIRGGVTLGALADSNRVQVVLQISAESGSSDPPIQVFAIETVFLFLVAGFGERLTDGRLAVPEGFDVTLASIAYSTTRGILLERLATTPFRDYVLPVVNPQELIHNEGKSEEGGAE